MSGALVALATPSPAGAPVVAPTLLGELPAGALRLAAQIASTRWPLTLLPHGEGVELRALGGSHLAELRCPQGFAAEVLRLPPAAVRSALGRHGDAAVASIWATDGGLLLRTLSAGSASATLLPRDGGDPLPPFPAHPAGPGPARFSTGLVWQLLGHLRQIAEVTELELGAGPDQPLTVRFEVAEGVTGRLVIAPIWRKPDE